MIPDIYKSLSEFCHPVDHEYDPLTGRWTYQVSSSSSAGLWLVLIAIFAASVLYLVSVWPDFVLLF